MLKELIDQFYADNFREKDKLYFYVTDAGKCPRAVYFKFKGVPQKKFDPRTLRIFDNGDYSHMRIMSTLFGLNLVRAVEIKIPPQETISGRADAIIGISGKPYVLEIKTISYYRFSKLKEPEPDHLKQIQLYLHYFKIPQGFLLYEDKNTQKLKEFLVHYSPDLVQSVLKELTALRVQIENAKIPPIPKNIKAWRCEYCEYSIECQKIKELK